ncbi:type VI secretion system amidase immunity protein Tai4 [Pseudomonas syringae pv. actinidifoliorum]|nr:type VI secretion system amidase immunity protein Tai4 [Pseudomonas syringae pv. actinidifoliorum]MDU8521314.1 type VI secretion system amidase immunity protein Tai4 [Pseudomonas syringae pv. actinidifoliorum]MDU8524610.1 type VI secretion system amidase immunity protein Tai4 [Pseudomonas syringae pv. actinidifoliorum]
MIPSIRISAVLLLLATSNSFAYTPTSSPEGMYRTFEKNYKDMALATCITIAYKYDLKVGIDAGSSVSAMRDWAYYDMEQSPLAVKALVEKYLARDYTNPLAESQIKGIRFDLLKCLDMYHSKELDTLTKKLVTHPNHTYMKNIKQP